MGSFGVAEWLIIFLIIVLFFGAKRIPGMARGLAQGYVEFRKARMDDPSDEDSDSISGDSASESDKEKTETRG